MGSAIWRGSKERMISTITISQDLMVTVLVAGVVFGILSVQVIDSFYKKNERLKEVNRFFFTKEDLKKRIDSVLIVNFSVLFGLGVVATFNTPILFNEHAPIFFSSLATGFVLGTQIVEYHNRNSNHKIKEFVQWVRKTRPINNKLQLNLSLHCHYLRYLNLAELGKEIRKEFKDDKELVLQDCRLTDSDLMRLKKAGWFSYFQNIIISGNPELTSAGLKCIMEGGAETVKKLDLSKTDLTDADLIQMAKSGSFNKLKTLIIQDNPKITKNGLLQIGKKGFDGLTGIDISGNSQLANDGFDDWIKNCGFKNLKIVIQGNNEAIKAQHDYRTSWGGERVWVECIEI